MKNKVLTLIALCAVAQASTAAPQPFHMRGSASCGQLVEAISKKDTDAGSQAQAGYASAWVWGYLAAYNARGLFDSVQGPREASSVEPPDEVTVYLFLDGYCRRHPTASLMNAAEALVRELGGKIFIPQGFQ
jgi:hypothetical protein